MRPILVSLHLGFLASALSVPFWLASCRPEVLSAKSVERPENPLSSKEKYCKVGTSYTRPLVVDWPSAERAALEGRAKRGVVVVAVSDCKINVLAQCKASGSYQYTGVTAKVDTETIANADELYAKIPAYAVSFEGKLKQSKKLTVAMKVVGRYDASQVHFVPSALEGECTGATHVVGGITTGAFRFVAAASASAMAAAEILVAKAGGSSGGSIDILNADGDIAACDNSKGDDKAPPDKCSAALRLELVALRGTDSPPSSVATLTSPTTQSTPTNVPTSVPSVPTSVLPTATIAATSSPVPVPPQGTCTSQKACAHVVSLPHGEALKKEECETQLDGFRVNQYAFWKCVCDCFLTATTVDASEVCINSTCNALRAGN